MNVRLKIVQGYALDYIKKHVLCNLESEIHYVNAFRNYQADTLGLPVQKDIFSPNYFSVDLLEQFKADVQIAINISAIACQLTHVLLDRFDVDNTSLKDITHLKALGRDLDSIKSR